jgi:hypothetical protein
MLIFVLKLIENIKESDIDVLIFKATEEITIYNFEKNVKW